MNIKSKDIAKLAGVSRSTVSRVINNYPNVPPETKKKVMEIIEKYGYSPNSSARALAGKTSTILGLFIVLSGVDKTRFFDSSYYSPFTSAVIDTATTLGYNILVSAIANQEDYEKVKELFTNKTISGGIFLGAQTNDPEISMLTKAGYKIAVIDQNELSSENYKNSILVSCDNVNGAENAVNYLIKCGHSKIGHITGDMEKLSGIERHAGYKSALKKSGIKYDKNLVVKGNFTEESGYKSMKKLLSGGVKITGVFVGNDSMAIGAIKYLNDKEIKVPDEISIIGYDDIILAEYIRPALTTIRTSILDMALIAVKNLVNFIENDISMAANYTIPAKLIIRESVKII